MRAAARAPSKPPPPAGVQPAPHRDAVPARAGAVMVYSASSARTLLQGEGDGTTYLVRYLVYGAIGFVALHVLARRGLEPSCARPGRCWPSRSPASSR